MTPPDPTPSEREKARAVTLYNGSCACTLNPSDPHGRTCQTHEAIAALLAREREEMSREGFWGRFAARALNKYEESQKALAAERAVHAVERARAGRYEDLLRRLLGWANSSHIKGALQIASLHGCRTDRAFTSAGVALWGEIHAALPDAPADANRQRVADALAEAAERVKPLVERELRGERAPTEGRG